MLTPCLSKSPVLLQRASPSLQHVMDGPENKKLQQNLGFRGLGFRGLGFRV